MTPTPVTLFTDHIIPTPFRASLPLEHRRPALFWAAPYLTPGTQGRLRRSSPAVRNDRFSLAQNYIEPTNNRFQSSPHPCGLGGGSYQQRGKNELCRPGTRTTPSPASPLRRSLSSSRSFRLPALEQPKWQLTINNIHNYVHIVHEERRPAGLRAGNRYKLKLRLKTTS